MPWNNHHAARDGENMAPTKAGLMRPTTGEYIT